MPWSAAMFRAFAIASAMFIEPLLTGLMALKSTLPVLDGWGRYEGIGGSTPGGAPGIPPGAYPGSG
jgi:hypothetical protein